MEGRAIPLFCLSLSPPPPSPSLSFSSFLSFSLQIHVIYQFKNPKTGDVEEKHSKQSSESMDFFEDKKTHLFTLCEGKEEGVRKGWRGRGGSVGTGRGREGGREGGKEAGGAGFRSLPLSLPLSLIGLLMKYDHPCIAF